LILRLFGAGSTLRQAIAELKALPPDALERRVMLPILVRLRFEVPADQEQQTSEDREFLMSTQDAPEGPGARADSGAAQPAAVLREPVRRCPARGARPH
jgi:hypothetical protein